MKQEFDKFKAPTTTERQLKHDIHVLDQDALPIVIHDNDDNNDTKITINDNNERHNKISSKDH